MLIRLPVEATIPVALASKEIQMAQIREVTVSTTLNTKRFELYTQSISPRTGKAQWNFKAAYWSLAEAEKAQAKIK